MSKYDSLPTTEQANLDLFQETLRKLNPELHFLQVALQETGVNPLLIPKVIRAIYNLSIGTGYGRVQIFMSNHRVTQIKGEESDQVEEDALIDK